MDIVYHEASSRNLTEKIFYALALVNSISRKSVPTTCMDDLLASNTHYHRTLLYSLISEGRTHALNKSKKTAINKIITQHPSRRFLFRKNIIFDTRGPKHIRYFFDESHNINLLYLHYEHLHAVKEIFYIIDLEAVNKMIEHYPTAGEGYVKVTPGMLTLKTHCLLPAYRANIKMLHIDEPVLLSSGEIRTIKLKLRNECPYIWVTSNNMNVKYGVTYHLLSTDIH